MDAVRLANAVRYFTAMNSRNIASLIEAFADDSRYHGNERNEGEALFHRRWLVGKEAIRQYLEPWTATPEYIEYIPTRIVSDSTTVNIEWTDRVKYRDTNGDVVSYENIGISIFEFEDGSDLIKTVRHYYDWDALAKSKDTGVPLVGTWAAERS
jgi:hypothetical protein